MNVENLSLSQWEGLSLLIHPRPTSVNAPRSNTDGDTCPRARISLSWACASAAALSPAQVVITAHQLYRRAVVDFHRLASTDGLRQHKRPVSPTGSSPAGTSAKYPLPSAVSQALGSPVRHSVLILRISWTSRRRLAGTSLESARKRWVHLLSIHECW